MNERPLTAPANLNQFRELRRMVTAANDFISIGDRMIERLAAQSGLPALVREGILNHTKPLPQEGRRHRFVETLWFPRVIGLDYCVEAPRVALDDPATFALIPQHHEPVRVVTDIHPTPCETLALVLENTGRQFHLIAAWIGRETPQQPHDTAFLDPFEEAKEEIEFWSTHALVHREGWGETWQSTWRRTIEDALKTDEAAAG
jgi:hypothetical protein